MVSTWVIGDVHGCHQQLKRLYRRLNFRTTKDRLWLTGDVVNRGPRSVEVLRWCMRREKKLGSRFAVVLGNHDLHALAVHYGVAKVSAGDTLDALLAAADREKLVGWLQQRPFLVRRKKITMVHAGLLPTWTTKDAHSAAKQLSTLLTSNPKRFLKGNGLKKKQRRALAALTRLRVFDMAGNPSRYSRGLKRMPKKFTPWFRHPERLSHGEKIVFGHWAALGFHQEAGVTGLDTGCVWGGALTALCLEDNRILQEPWTE